MIRRLLVLFILMASITSCAEADKKIDESKPNITSGKFGKQLKISILWDLSDRMNPQINKELPSQADRDIAIIKYFADHLKSDMDKKGAYMAKGNLKVFFSPNPTNPDINFLSSKLDIDLTNKDVKLKKEIYDSISRNFENTAKQICDITIKTSKWEGSDIFRFFKNDVFDYCVSKDTSYRNILVILTDGYIYHPQSKERVGNKTAYILSDLINSLGLRKSQDLKSSFQSTKCGLISTRKDLNNLEILVLEINSEANHKNDEDIIKFYLQNWFSEMNTKRFEIYNTDLPENTKKRITDFLSYRD